MSRIFLSKLFVAFRTEDKLFAQTSAALLLVINTNGKDVVHGKLEPVSNYARTGFANLFEIEVPNAAPCYLNSSTYFRIEIGTARAWSWLSSDYRDAWKPKRVAVWGVSGNECIPLAFIDNNDTTLAQRHDSGVSIPVRSVGRLDRAGLISELLIVIATAKSLDAGTADTIRIEISSKNKVPGHPVFLDKKFNDSNETVFGNGVVTIFRLGVSYQMTINRLFGGTIVITNTGCDEWLPKSIFIFGIAASKSGKKRTHMECLLACPQWGNAALSQKDGDSRNFMIGNSIIKVI